MRLIEPCLHEEMETLTPVQRAEVYVAKKEGDRKRKKAKKRDFFCLSCWLLALTLIVSAVLWL